jgi:hypothetical protein
MFTMSVLSIGARERKEIGGRERKERVKCRGKDQPQRSKELKRISARRGKARQC